MAISNGYATLAELRSKIDYTSGNTTDDTELENIIEAVSRNIDQFCRRVFYQRDATALVYSAEWEDYLPIDDLYNTTGLTVKADTTGNGTFDETWTITTDFVMHPSNPRPGHPFTHVQRSRFGSRSFPVGANTVEVTGNYGWAAIPPGIKEACLLEASRLHARRTAPFGVAGNTDMGVAFLGAVNDPQARVLLQPFVRDPVLI